MWVDAASISVMGCALDAGVSGAEGAGALSCRVPHDPHSGQRPSHFGDEYPHSEQVWILRGFLAICFALRLARLQHRRGHGGIHLERSAVELELHRDNAAVGEVLVLN